MNLRAKEMADAIRAETKGRVDIQIFPNNQLGSDTDMLSQLRSGGIEFFTLSGLILATLVPAARSTASASRSRITTQVWKAMDGELGAWCAARSPRRPLVPGQDLGQRLPPDHLVDQADQQPRRLQGLQDPRAGVAAVDLDVQGLRRLAGLDQFQPRSIRRCRPRSSRARRTRWR
jgi:hypothetical protein